MNTTSRLVRSRRTVWLSSGAFAGLFALGLSLSMSAAALADDDDDGGDAAKPCMAKKFEFKQVEEACQKGGAKEAKALMKKVVKKMKEGGQAEANCKSCHESLKTTKLKKNAVADLKKWL